MSSPSPSSGKEDVGGGKEKYWGFFLIKSYYFANIICFLHLRFFSFFFKKKTQTFYWLSLSLGV